MKILVLSDSHSGLRFMRRCIAAVKPDAVVHLGDYYDDAGAMAEENPNIVFHTVPGNCDQYRCPLNTPQILAYSVCGVKLYMTHGHLHGVKSGVDRLLRAAREFGAQAVLFGHTHSAVCYQELDGLWVLNPGSCGTDSGSAGVIETDGESISACNLIKQADIDGILCQSQ